MENSERDKLREGDSARAQAYRLKDKLLSFNYSDLAKHLEAKGLQETVQGKFGELHEHLKVLVKEENNEEAGKGATDTLQAIHQTLVDSGFEFTAQ